MPIAVASFYQFAALPDHRVLREPLLALATSHDLRGSILLAAEGINGTVAGTPAALDAFLAVLRDGALFAGRLDALSLRRSEAPAMPFRRLKVRLRREIVTLGDPAIDPTRRTGIPVAPGDWDALLAEPDVTLIDTRNGFEVAMGSFVGALDPKLEKFGDFPGFAAATLDPARHRRVAMFCTGGIRCEKASTLLLERGFAEVYQLRGGILAYLDDVPVERSRWQGTCFVFDERVALGQGLVPVADHAHD